jgi:hypothetical protein
MNLLRITQAVTGSVALAIYLCLPLLAADQATPPAPVLVELKRTEPPHVEIVFRVKGNVEHLTAIKIIRRLLVDGTREGPQIIDKETTINPRKLKAVSYVASKDESTCTWIEKQMPPNTTNVYLFSVVAIGEDGASAESNKIEVRP